jgi:hypothetical protein
MPNVASYLRALELKLLLQPMFTVIVALICPQVTYLQNNKYSRTPLIRTLFIRIDLALRVELFML